MSTKAIGDDGMRAAISHEGEGLYRFWVVRDWFSRALWVIEYCPGMTKGEAWDEWDRIVDGDRYSSCAESIELMELPLREYSGTDLGNL